MLAVIMGGAIYTHVVKEGKPAASVGALLYFGFSCAVPIDAGSARPSRYIKAQWCEDEAAWYRGVCHF